MNALHRPFLEVLEAGALTTIQDSGREGLAHLGVPPSGFLDGPAARLANRLVGNDEDEALMETTVSGPSLRLHMPAKGEAAALVVAVTGASVPVRIDGRLVDQHQAFALRDGQRVELGTVTTGVRCYLAVRGGIRVAPVLGSSSTDLMSGLGPPALERGQRLPVGLARNAVPPADFVAVPSIPIEVELGVFAGPSSEWFAPGAWAIFTSTPWSVSPTSSRIGLRLRGSKLPRRNDDEMPPEGMVTGSVQVPPDGQPVILLMDRPVTGGYPVIGVVREGDLHLAAQAAPGTVIRFRALTNQT